MVLPNSYRLVLVAPHPRFYNNVFLVSQVFEITELVPRYSYWSVLRAPRPLILVRVFRVFLKFQMPKSKLESVFK